MMDGEFWSQKWARNDIGFHEKDVNPMLLRYIDALSLAAGSRLFVPLCGKTRDIGWLLSQGFRIAGAELSTIAVDQLFDELGVVPAVAHAGKLRHYRASNIDVFAGDIFHLSRQMLGDVDAVYDRAAFVALPAEMRLRYSAHIAQLTGKAKQLLICYEYDQGAMAGPPFSIGAADVAQHYIGRNAYHVTLLGSVAINGGFKGKIPAVETAWLLRNSR